MQNTGIVMQIADGQAIVMTKGCEFRKIPLLDGMAVGQEVELPMQVQVTPEVRKKPLAWFGTPLRKTGVMAATVLLAVGIWGSQSMFHQDSAYAYVTMDINPSVEFAVDQHKQVMNATALNNDGQQVLDGLKVSGMSVDQAIESVAEAAKTKGFFKDKTDVIITASPAVSDDKLASDHLDLDSLENELVAQVKTVATTAGTGVAVEGIRVSQSVRDAAKQAGISPGKYAVYLNAQSNGINISLDELKQNSITTVVGDHGEALAQVVHSLEGGTQLDQLLNELKHDGKITPTRVVPSAAMPEVNPQQNDTSNSPQPANPPKNADDGNKHKTQGNQDNGNSKSNGAPASDREHSDSGNSAQNGNKHQSDDSEHDKGNHSGQNKQSYGQQDHQGWFQQQWDSLKQDWNRWTGNKGHDGQDGHPSHGVHEEQIGNNGNNGHGHEGRSDH